MAANDTSTDRRVSRVIHTRAPHLACSKQTRTLSANIARSEQQRFRGASRAIAVTTARVDLCLIGRDDRNARKVHVLQPEPTRCRHRRRRVRPRQREGQLREQDSNADHQRSRGHARPLHDYALRSCEGGWIKGDVSSSTWPEGEQQPAWTHASDNRSECDGVTCV
jgi:hypothetical protein